ncbi:acyltransferase family protein [Desulfoscipio sp. XC116]|uniref:acyltransferase family protein n=1 Tax=Desulfoscipio sp. XC116 TaxID=3144975 RepID=UPI00325A85CD
MKTDHEISVKPIAKKSRLVFLDNLKVALILLVVAHHAGQAYGPENDWPILSIAKSAILGPFFDVNGAFFMGLFFLISAYFLPPSIDRKGVGTFLKSRLLRLGVPFIVIVIIIFGPITYFVDGIDMPFWTYMILFYIGQGDFEVGHLWFIALLLFFFVCYAIVRLIASTPIIKGKVITTPPGYISLVIFSIALIIANYIIRIWFPVGEWVKILPFMPVEVGRCPQYVGFFIVGVFAYRYNWLNTFSTKTGLVWLAIGILAGAMHYIDSLIGLFPLSLDFWTVLEGFIGVGLVTGSLVISREYWNKRGKLMTFMADNAFTVYLIHIFIIYLLQGIMEAISMGPFNKFMVVSIMGIILSFVLSHFIRKIPFAKKFL